MMQVEEKPDVTYSDVGGCKEQIDKLREVVETPLLHVSSSFIAYILGMKIAKRFIHTHAYMYVFVYM